MICELPVLYFAFHFHTFPHYIYVLQYPGWLLSFPIHSYVSQLKVTSEKTVSWPKSSIRWQNVSFNGKPHLCYYCALQNAEGKHKVSEESVCIMYFPVFRRHVRLVGKSYWLQQIESQEYQLGLPTPRGMDTVYPGTEIWHNFNASCLMAR